MRNTWQTEVIFLSAYLPVISLKGAWPLVLSTVESCEKQWLFCKVKTFLGKYKFSGMKAIFFWGFTNNLRNLHSIYFYTTTILNQNFDPLEHWRPTLCKEYYTQEDIYTCNEWSTKKRTRSILQWPAGLTVISNSSQTDIECTECGGKSRSEWQVSLRLFP